MAEIVKNASQECAANLMEKVLIACGEDNGTVRITKDLLSSMFELAYVRGEKAGVTDALAIRRDTQGPEGQ